MKRFLSVFLTSFLFINYIKSQKDHQIALWYKFSDCAITYTFDDNTPKQLTVALPILDSLGFKATFYPVINWQPDWNGFKKASSNGHEIACHTVSHPFLNQIDSIKEELEYQNSINIINTNTQKNECLTIAYPYCITGKINIIKKYFIGGRICNGMIVPPTPSDFYNISSILIGSESEFKTAESLNKKVNEAKTMNGWCIFLLHGIDNDGGYSNFSSEELKKHLIYVKQNQDKYWVTTFANAIKYIKERDCATVEEQLINKNSILFKIKDTLDNNIFNAPLTVKRALPANWKNAKVLINDKQVDYSLKTINNKKYIIFDIIPDEQIARIIKTK